MSYGGGSVAVLDREPTKSDLLTDVIAGLTSAPRTLPCKYFYDERGSELFQKICELPEYYVTRTEITILRLHAHEMAELIGAQSELIGLGTGAGTKTRILLDELRDPVAYVPVDISKEQLEQSTRLFQKLFPSLEILPVCADYLQPVVLPTPAKKPSRNVVYFPGSTIGNFEPEEAINFLRRICNACGKEGGLLIGVDLQKDREILERAYDDAQGVTAQFNLNLLTRANHEIGADFRLDEWKHRAIYNADVGRIEMHLISKRDQTVHIADQEFRFRDGEGIVTEYSYKYTPEGFDALAAKAGFRRTAMWSDNAQLFGVFYFTVW